MRSLLVCMHVNTCMHMCVHTYAYIYIHICSATYAYIYIHICSASDLFEDVVGILMCRICVYARICVCLYVEGGEDT